ncbi:transcriptional regulator with XRE-family HTH domain [Rhizobium aquaticum]|uniref:Transcriptional regulator with XRE-family HTH domain n=1 Tax=Rhizobium aquaticum TaxID=1549636 RepID=A0ABV2IUB8_9HYPH
MIDSEWFYRQLEKDGRSLRAMARALGLDPSAVSRMLKGERKMSADEQDGIAGYLGVSINEVAARRRGEAVGFAEKGQEAFVMDDRASSQMGIDSNQPGREEQMSYYERVRARMKGTVTIPPGVDVTEPADPEWGRVYDDDYEYPIHL